MVGLLAMNAIFYGFNYCFCALLCLNHTDFSHFPNAELILHNTSIFSFFISTGYYRRYCTASVHTESTSFLMFHPYVTVNEEIKILSSFTCHNKNVFHV